MLFVNFVVKKLRATTKNTKDFTKYTKNISISSYKNVVLIFMKNLCFSPRFLNPFALGIVQSPYKNA